MPLTLRFLWHMHQPDYRDASGRMGMPWVFLHAIKYY
jgi:alpha-amylase/alpha-mannosidase (GH57 family)